MPSADLNAAATKILITSEYREKETIRSIPGVRWDAGLRQWTLPVSWTSCKMLRAIFPDSLQISSALNDWARKEYAERILPTMAARAKALDPEVDEEGDERLYPFQKTGACFLVAAGSAILADEMGTGKTVQTIAALQTIGDLAYPVLIVCPSSVKGSWEREFAKWAPMRSVSLISGSAAKRVKQIEMRADVTIINYDALRFHSRLAGYGSIALTAEEKTPKDLQAFRFASVVADEAHRIKDPKAKQTRALKACAEKSDYRFALSGTPVANNPDDLWSLLHFIAPKEWPSRTKFVDRYCLTSWNGFGTDILGLAPEKKEEFYEILDPRFLRRPKSLVLPQLPEKTYETREVAMLPAQRKAYTTMERSFIAECASGSISASSILTQGTRLAQFASATCDVDESGSVKMVGPSNKISGLLEILDDLPPSESVVVFAEHRQLIDLAEAALIEKKISYGRVTGKENEQQREAAIEKFQNKDLQIMLLTLGAGGVGITLTAARIVVFLERSWSLVNNLQAEDRIHRFGQEASSVLVIDLIAPGTIEEIRIEALVAKDRKLEEVVRDGPTLAAYLIAKGKKR